MSLAACQEKPDTLVVEVRLSRSNILPVLLDRRFDAVTQQTFAIDPETGVRTNYPTADRFDTILVTVSVHKRASSEPAIGVAVKVEAFPRDSSGGHIHVGHVPRPTGSFFTLQENSQVSNAGPHPGMITLTTDSTGTVRARYRSSGIGGVERIVGTPEGEGPPSVPDTTDLTIRVEGLIQMDSTVAERYVFKPQNTSNPEMQHGNNNRWIRGAFRDSVLEVFDDFFAGGGVVHDPDFGDLLLITDVGLVFGGLYDYDQATEWRSPHKTHRIGNDMDIRSSSMSLAQHDIMERACRTNRLTRPRGTTARVDRCTWETTPLHLHIKGLTP